MDDFDIDKVFAFYIEVPVYQVLSPSCAGRINPLRPSDASVRQ